MKSLLTSLVIMAMAFTSFSQWKHDINSAGNPALKLPYKIIDPFQDSFLAGHPLIHKKTLDFRTQKLVYAGMERYPIDANKNNKEIFWTNFSSGKLDTMVYHNLDISYTGTNPTKYRIESWNNNKKTSIRNATATFSGSVFNVVNYTDSNFISGIRAVTYAVDSFITSSGLVNELYMKRDTGGGMIHHKLHRFTYASGKVTEHFTDEWNANTSKFDKKEKVRVTYDGNGNTDSILTYSWLSSGSKWEIGKTYDYDYNTSKQMTKYTLLNNNGSGMLELKDKWELKYNGNGTIDQMEKFDYQSSAWVSEAIRTAFYNTAGDTLKKVEQKIKFGTVSFVSLVWIYGDTSNTPPPKPPAAPSNLASTIGPRAVSDKAVTLTWKDNSNNEDGFKIERKKKAGGTYAVVGAVLKDIVTYKDTSNLEESMDYTYRVIATINLTAINRYYTMLHI